MNESINQLIDQSIDQSIKEFELQSKHKAMVLEESRAQIPSCSLEETGQVVGGSETLIHVFCCDKL